MKLIKHLAAFAVKGQCLIQNSVIAPLIMVRPA